MSSIGSASLSVYPTFPNLQSNLDRGTSKAMTAAGLKGGDAFGDSAGRSAGSKFRSHVSKAAKIAAVGLAATAAAGFKFAGDSLAEAREAQKIGAQTDAVIKSTGRAAKVTARDVGNLAGKLSDKAGIDDELIQSGANVLLTFTKIRNEVGEGNKVFDRATAAALNMSVALDQDLKSASIQVGKALNDPVKGVTALGRAGVQFSEDQKAAIKKMVETGDTLGAQKMILKELDTQFRGSARSQATEADKLSVAYGNLKEEVGTALIPVMDDLSVFLRKKGIPAVRDAAGWVRDDFIPAVKDAYDEMKPLIGAVKDLGGFLSDLPKPAKIAGIAALVGGITYGKMRGGNLGGGGALGTAGKVLGLAKPVPVFVTNPGFGGGPGGAPGKGGFLATAGKFGMVGLLAGAAYAMYKMPDIWNFGAKKLGGALGLTPKSGGPTPGAAGSPEHKEILKGWQGAEGGVNRYNEKLERTRDHLLTVTNGVTGFASEAEKARDKVLKVTNGVTVLGDKGQRAGERAGDGLRNIGGAADKARERVRLLAADLDWVARPREARITITRAYAGAGMQTRGGPQATTEGPRGGVTVNVGTVQAHDYDDFMTQTQRRAHRAALEGRRG